MKEKKQKDIKVGKRKNILRNNMITAMILGPAILIVGVSALYAIWWVSSKIFSWVQGIANTYVFPWMQENWVIALSIWAAIIVASLIYQIIFTIMKNKKAAKKIPERKVIYEEIEFEKEEIE